MKRTLLTFLFVILAGFFVSTVAQGWVLEVEVDINHSDCALEKLTSTTVTFAGVSGSGSSDNSRTTIFLKGTGSTLNKTLSISASGTCAQSYDPVNPVSPFSESFSGIYSFDDCSSVSYGSDYADKVDINGPLKFYPRMVIGTPSPDCSSISVKLSSLNCKASTALTWEVSNTSTGPWYIISGKKASNISVTADELNNSNFGGNKYGPRWVRVTSVKGTTSEAREIKMPVPPPSIESVTGIPPICPDGEGSIQVVHGSNTPLGVEFVYTVTQYVAMQSGTCPSGYGTGNSLTQADIDNLGSFCSGAGKINIGSATYCSGKKGNYRKTFTGSNLAYTLLPGNSIEEIGVPGNYLTLLPGIYLIEVEVSTSTVTHCICRYVVEIPPANTSLTVPQNSIVKTTPACKGGNDGSATLTVGIREKYDANNDIRYTLFRLAGSVYSVYNSRQNMTTNLTSSKLSLNNLEAGDYKITVWDICVNYPTTSFFQISEGPLLNISRLPGHPLCLTDSDSDGNAESGDGRLTVLATALSGKTYTFNLYSSGGSLIETQSNISTNWCVFKNLINIGYYATVKTSNNCKGDSLQRTLISPVILSMDVFSKDAMCSNSADGKIELKNISKLRGTIKYSYALKNSVNGVLIQSGSGVTNAPEYIIPRDLSIGTYNLAITDQCVTAPNTKVFTDLIVSRPKSVLITQHPDIKIECFDGVTASPVTISYQFGTPDYTVDVKKDNVSIDGYPAINQSGTSFQLSNLQRGAYTVIVTDDCGVQNSMSFKVYSASATAINAFLTKFRYDNNNDETIDERDYHLTCPEKNDGQIMVRVAGGIRNSSDPKYIIEVLNGSGGLLIHNVTNPINGSGQISAGIANGSNEMEYKITGLAEDIPYQIQVTDFNSDPGGCTKIFTRDINGEYLSLSTPPPLLLKIPGIFNDFTNLPSYNGDLFVKCKEDTAGTYTAIVSGGNPPYTISLYRKMEMGTSYSIPILVQNNILNGKAVFDNLGAGYYKVTTVDQQDCSYEESMFQIREANETLQVTQITPLEYSNGANTSCPLSLDGMISVNAVGGVGDLTFNLLSELDTISVMKSSSTHTFPNLGALNSSEEIIEYSLTVNDALNCFALSPASGNKINLKPPDQVVFTWTILSKTFPGYAIPCYQDSAIVSVQSRGGAFPHYATIGAVTRSISSESDYAEFLLPAGNYEISVEDNLRCSAMVQTIKLNEPSSKVAINLDGIESPACIGGSDGRIMLSAANGVSIDDPDTGYIFLAKKILSQHYDLDTLRGNGVVFFRGANKFASQDYSVLVMDKHHCMDELLVTIPANSSPLTISLDSSASPLCYDGSDGLIKVSASNYELISGGKLKFLLSGGHLGNLVSEIYSDDSTITFRGLEATDLHGYSPYKVWIEDKNKCIDTAFQYLPAVKLQSIRKLAVDLVRAIRPGCFNGADGSLFLRISGGKPPYEYSTDGIDFFSAPSAHTIFLPSLSAGTYTIYVRDASFNADSNSCLSTNKFQVPNGRFIRLESELKNVSCKGGGDGEVELLMYVDFKDPDEEQDNLRFSLFWTKDEVSSEPISSANKLTGLQQGVFTAHVTYDLDSTQCKNEKTVIIPEPALPFSIATIKIYNTSCGFYSDGKALVNISGGWADSTGYYRLDNGSWSLFRGASILLIALAPGIHQLEIAQCNFSCTDSRQFQIESSTLPLEIARVFAPSCPFAKDAIVVLKSDDVNVSYAIENERYQSLGVFDKLDKGTYHFLARKNSDTLCVSSVVKVDIVDPPDCGKGPLIIEEVVTISATCSKSGNGRIQVKASGGVPPYTFFWDGSTREGGDFKDSLSVGSHTILVKDLVNTVNEISISVPLLEPLSYEVLSEKSLCSSTCDGSIGVFPAGGSGLYTILWNDGKSDFHRINLCSGDYTIRITDQSSPLCFISENIFLDHVSDLSITEISNNPPTCQGGTDGRLITEIAGGSGRFQYSWNNGLITKDLEGTASGDYTLTVTDEVSTCKISKDFTLHDKTGLVVEEIAELPRCYGSKDGKVTLDIENAYSPLVEWEDGQIGLSVYDLSAGNHHYKITEADGCIVNGVVTLPDHPLMQVTQEIKSVTCFSTCDGAVDLKIIGGVAPYFVSWDHGPRFKNLNNLCSSRYAYTIEDNNNCLNRGEALIESPALLEIEHVHKDVSCYNESNGYISILVQGGTSPYNYFWNTDSTRTALANLKAGEYSVIVRDSNECIAQREFRIHQPPELLLKKEKLTDPSCIGTPDGEIILEPKGGTGTYHFLWEDGTKENFRRNLASGKYSVTLRDANNCMLTKDYFLKIAAPLEIVNVSLTNPQCFGESNGSVAMSVIGGAPPYNYRWSDGSLNNFIKNIGSGTYNLILSDQKECLLEEAFVLNDPVLPTIVGLPEKMLICSGGIAVVEPQGEWNNYRWTGPVLFDEGVKRLQTSVPGVYTLTAWDSRNCKAVENVEIEVSEKALSVDILRISEAIALQPIVFVDISIPIPDRVEWLVPESANVGIHYKSSSTLELIFLEGGNFEIGMRGSLGKCISEIYRTVSVTEPTPSDSIGGRLAVEKNILAIEVYPNPATSQLEIRLVCSSKDPVKLRFQSGMDSRKIIEEVVEGQHEYLIRWSIPDAVTGVYHLIAKQNNNIQSKRIIILK